jgi:hypothetical protein
MDDTRRTVIILRRNMPNLLAEIDFVTLAGFEMVRRKELLSSLSLPAIALGARKSGAARTGAAHEDMMTIVVPGGGFEPPTRGFSVRCSTN